MKKAGTDITMKVSQKPMIMRALLTALALAALTSGHARAEVIKPKADLTAIKTPAGELTMVNGLIPMHNAHDIATLGFFKRSASGPATLVPFEFDSDYEPLLKLRTGADCMVSSARALREGERLRVVYAQRKGEWSDKKPVSFQIFELTVNDEGAPGTPPIYFVLKKTVVSKTAYCDVDAALDKEAALYTQKAK